MHIITSIDSIKEYFENKSTKINNTRELNNVLLSYSDCKEPNTSMVTELDGEERNWILNEIHTAIEKLKKDINTRQAIIYNLHKSNLDHNCLNLLHLFYRDGKLNMNVYIRSMNIDDNFDHDMYTFMLALEKASDELKLEIGVINAFIMSLHSFKL